jgi:RNA polymerase sigma factor (sigma-70 family)
MPEASDMELLRKYVQHGEEEAFAELVQRHVHLVYSAAIRHVAIAAHADEITQVVFVILARKAAALHPDTILEGWLYGTTRLVSLNFLRAERRRQFREQEAYMQSTLQEPTNDPSWNQLAPLLDEGMSQLRKKDRDAVMLRYFKNKSVREVAAAMDVTEAAAQKRVHRAVEKLRLFFAERGLQISASVLMDAITANAIQNAPATLAAAAAATAISNGATASSSTITLIKGALKIMAWTKAKTAIAIGAGVLLASGVTIKEVQSHRSYPWQDMVDGGRQAMKALDTAPPQVTIVRSKFTADKHGRLFDDIGLPDRWRFIATHVTPEEIVRGAYVDPNHINTDKDFLVIKPADMPGDFYDYIANLPSGSRERLQSLAKEKFRLTGRYENRELDVLLLKVSHPNAPGLNPSTTASTRQELTIVRNGNCCYATGFEDENENEDEDDGELSVECSLPNDPKKLLPFVLERHLRVNAGIG